MLTVRNKLSDIVSQKGDGAYVAKELIDEIDRKIDERRASGHKDHWKQLESRKKKVNEMDGEIEDLYHDRLVYGDNEGDLSGYNEFKKEQEKYFNSMDKFETQLIQDKKEKAVIKHIKDMLNNNKKHNELIENLLNELCELNNLKEDNNND